MKKEKLISFIEKYHLEGLINAVKWEIKDGEVTVNFVNNSKSLVGSVKRTDIGIEDSKFAIYTTSELLKMLAMYSEEFDLKFKTIGNNPIALMIKDETNKAEYILSDPDIIPPSPGIKTLPSFEIEVDIDKMFISNFLRVRAALADAPIVKIHSTVDEAVFNLGYHEQNTNNISFKGKSTINATLSDVSFSADDFKCVLFVNKNCDSGKISVSNHGLMQMRFVEEDIVSEYYLVKFESL